MNTNIRFIRQNEINDIFAYTDGEGGNHYISYPRTMEMGVKDVVLDLSE